jgi:hypothetical protein
VNDQLEPEILSDGAILAPITQANGQQTMVRLEPGEEEHAAWLGYMQRQRVGRKGLPPDPVEPGWYVDPFSEEGRERWWDGKKWQAEWRDPTGPPPPPRPPRPDGRAWWAPSQVQMSRNRRRSLIVGGIVFVLGGLWYSGSLDEPLSHIGLNKNACIKNAFGATYCGDEAKSYCDSLSELRALSKQHTACDDIEEP